MVRLALLVVLSVAVANLDHADTASHQSGAPEILMECDRKPPRIDQNEFSDYGMGPNTVSWYCPPT
jgi:hypothetical protein